jgi:hypothetical protein
VQAIASGQAGNRLLVAFYRDLRAIDRVGEVPLGPWAYGVRRSS